MASILKQVIILAVISISCFLTYGCHGDQAKDSLTTQEREWLDQHDGLIRFAAETNYPPLIFIDENEVSKGLSADYIKLIEKNLNFKFKIAPHGNLGVLLKRARKKEIDILTSLTETPQRSEFLLFTEPYIKIPTVIVVRKQMKQSLTLGEMKGMNVAVWEGSGVQSYLEENYPGISLAAFPDDTVNLRKLSFGEVDAAIIDLAGASQVIEKESITNLRVAGNANYTYDLCIGSRKDWPVLNQILKKGLMSISANERQSIYDKWIRLGGEQFNWVPIIIGFLVAFSGLGFILIWNLSLKRQVKHRTNQLKEELSERKQAEEALRESKEEHRILLEEATDPIFSMTFEGQYTFVNRAFAEGVGKYADDIVGKTIWDVFPKEDADKRFSALNQVFKTGTEKTIEVRVPQVGMDSYYLTTITPITDIDGQISSVICSSKDISDRKRAEEKLQKSEEKYRSIFENSVEGFFQSTPEGRFINVNPSFAKILGYESPEELISSISDIGKQYYANKEDRHWNMQLLQKYGFVENIEFQVKRKGGSYIWVSTSARAFFDQGGKIVRYEGNVIDISKSRKTLEELKKLSAAIKQSSVSIIITDTQGNIEYVNPKFCQLTGYSAEEAIGKNPRILKSGETPKEIYKQLWETILNGKEWRGEFRNKKKDGEWYWENAVISPISNEDGEITHLLAVKEDITEKRQAEKLLKKSEKQYRTLFNSITDLIYTQDLDGRFISVNPAMKRLFNYKTDELIGHKATDFMEAKFQFGFKNRYLEEVMKQRYHEGIVCYFKKNKEKIYLEYKSYLVEPNDAKPYISGIGRDVTEKVLSEKKVKKLQEQVAQSQKMESIGTLAGGIAHDFNNILFPIVGHTEMLLEDVPADSPFREGLSQIYTGALRASELVKQILTFSRQKNGEFKLMKMQPIIKEALKLIRSTIPTTISINQSLQPDCGAVKADPTQIHQIVMNLATNAYHAMEESGGELKVSLKEVELGEYDIITPNMTPGVYACLIIVDTGVGMDKNLTEKIFDPFFTTKAIGKGTGMGLSVVHGIVTAMGGAIHVYSEPGKGTQFYVYLPVEKSLSETQVTHATIPIQGGTEQILLVDDEEAILQMEKQMLERLGYQVTSRTSSIEAFEAFRANSNNYDLVITDMQMPNMSGDKLAVELTKIRADIPILLCTGFSETMSEEKAESFGINGFLLKPIVMKDLAQKIREVLDDVDSSSHA